MSFLGVSVVGTQHAYLVTELMHYGNLKQLVQKKGSNLTWKMRVRLLSGAAKGMAYLHKRNLIHRDLKVRTLPPYSGAFVAAVVLLRVLLLW